jgi:hypothetical protein
MDALGLPPQAVGDLVGAGDGPFKGLRQGRSRGVYGDLGSQVGTLQPASLH